MTAHDDVLFAGVPVRRTSPEAAVAELVARAVAGTAPTSYRFVNSYTLALADQDREYHRLLSSGGVNLPDGGPLAAFLRRRHPGPPTCHQVRGPSVFEQCLERGRSAALRHYFLGGSPDVLAAVVRVAQERFPGIVVAGSESPPFRALTPAEQDAQDQRIVQSGAQVVWVGLGTPKQDAEAARILASTQITTAAVGAAFDFLAGSKPEAPALLRRLYLEWLFRLATEPRRLWRRYLFGNARFLRLVLRDLRGR